MSLRRSRGTPVERRIGPVKPQLMASAAEMTPTLRVRSMKMRLRSMRPWTRPVKSSYWSRITPRRCEPAFRQIARQAADAAVRVGDARAGQVGQMLVDVVADHHQIEEGRHRAQFHQRCGHAREVIGDARVLGEQRAQVAAARRDLDAHQRLDGLAIGEVVDEPRAVVEAIDVRNQVAPTCGLRTPSRSRDAGSRSARRRA